MSSRGRTYEDYLSYAKRIDELIEPLHISSTLLATLMRVHDKVQLAQKNQERESFMQSEFSGIGTDMLVDLGYLTREFRTFDWHPTGIKGTYYYSTTSKGVGIIAEANAIIHEAGLKLYY